MKDLKQDELRKVDTLRQRTIDMAEQVQAMFHTVFDGLMKNDMGIINQVLKDEGKVTEVYNNLTALAVEDSKEKLSAGAKKMILDLVDIISLVEEIGDSCVGLVEQIEYKIRENLLFSQTAVQEYKDLHAKVEQIFLDTIKVMKDKDSKLAKQISNSKSGVDALVDKYRANHIERSAQGTCSEWARVRFLEMLNITQTVTYYCLEIAGKLI